MSFGGIASQKLAIGLIAAMVESSCSYFSPVLDIPLSPATGHIRSPAFSIDSNATYALGIGTERMEVDAATCRAATQIPGVTEKLEKGGYKSPPCHMLTPAIGAFTWKIGHNGKVVAIGSQSGLPPIPWGPSPHSMMSEKITWQFFDHFDAKVGAGYVVELELQSSNIALERFHPRLGIVRSFN